MIAVIIGTLVGTLLAIVAQHYIRQGLKRWIRKQESK